MAVKMEREIAQKLPISRNSVERWSMSQWRNWSGSSLVIVGLELQLGGCSAILYMGRCVNRQLKGSVKDPNMLHNYKTEKITRKASDAVEILQL